jgi:hypothetical protein
MSQPFYAARYPVSSRFHPQAYPPHWPALRQAVLARAAYTCECQGECGSGHGPTGRCHAPQYAHVVRVPEAPWRWGAVPPDAPPVAGQVIRIVLAAAHRCQDSTCADLACLRAYCQGCHLRYDHAQQWRTRRRKGREALERAGQLRLWPL